MKPIRIVIAAVAATFLFIFVIEAIVIITGAYDFAADVPHTAIVTKLIAMARERSVEVRASGLDVPPLDDPKMIADGAEHYAAMCTGCHLAPGMRENEMRPGLNPKPPLLASLPAEDPREQFWIVKHGLKMTAMPAWGTTHTDEDIWNIVAFLQKLPGMSPARYRELARNAHHDHMSN